MLVITGVQQHHPNQAWVMCWGILLHSWDEENITKIVNGIGEVVDVLTLDVTLIIS